MIDETIRKIEKQFYWNKEEYITQLYEDGINLEKKGSFYDFVKIIYHEAGGNRFFDKFVSKHYKRDIAVWRHTVESQKVLKTDKQIATTLQAINFKEFDIDKDSNINFYEFHQCIKKLGYFVEGKKLKEIFDKIDSQNGQNSQSGTITNREFQRWKEYEQDGDIGRVDTLLDDEKNEQWFVYYDNKQQLYEFKEGEMQNIAMSISELQKVTRIKKEIDENMRWALYANKLNSRQIRSFKGHDCAPNGYWVLFTDDIEKTKQSIKVKSIKEEMSNKDHLNAIYLLLHHYYMLNIDEKLQKKYKDDNTPLRKAYCSDLDISIDPKVSLSEYQHVTNIYEDIRFYIQGTEYQLTWWNQKGQYEPNAITLINVTEFERKNEKYFAFSVQFDEKEEDGSDLDPREFKQMQMSRSPRKCKKPELIELSYMRFPKYDRTKSKVEWQV